MALNTPFIHLMKTPLAYYFFDVNTNRFVQIEEKLYNYLSLEQQADKNYTPIDNAIKDDAINKALEALRTDGFLSSKRPEKLRHGFSDHLDTILDKEILHITLQLTQQCNFRCVYCIYAPNEFEFQRSHSPKRMSKETAIKAIDFLAAHSSGTDRIALSFYGGEPLLEYDLMHELVLYAEELFEGRDLLFSVTTNASLITREIAEFLSQHNFILLISIDGTPQIHDRGRKFAANGMGTYSTIESNLQMIQNDFSELYDKISFNMVVDTRFSTQEVHAFIMSNPLFKDKSVTLTVVNDGVNFEKHAFSEDYVINERAVQFYALLNYFGRFPSDKISNPAKIALETKLTKFKKAEYMSTKELPDIFSHGGPCIPGQKKLLVDTDGNFFPCERVSETSSDMQIGNLEQGINVEKCVQILNVCELTEHECKNCWALTHCILCVSRCDNNGCLSGDLKLSSCNDVRVIVRSEFNLFLFLNELKDKFEEVDNEKHSNISI